MNRPKTAPTSARRARSRRLDGGSHEQGRLKPFAPTGTRAVAASRCAHYQRDVELAVELTLDVAAVRGIQKIIHVTERTATIDAIPPKSLLGLERQRLVREGSAAPRASEPPGAGGGTPQTVGSRDHGVQYHCIGGELGGGPDASSPVETTSTA